MKPGFRHGITNRRQALSAPLEALSSASRSAAPTGRAAGVGWRGCGCGRFSASRSKAPQPPPSGQRLAPHRLDLLRREVRLRRCQLRAHHNGIFAASGARHVAKVVAVAHHRRLNHEGPALVTALNDASLGEVVQRGSGHAKQASADGMSVSMPTSLRHDARRSSIKARARRALRR